MSNEKELAIRSIIENMPIAMKTLDLVEIKLKEYEDRLTRIERVLKI